MKRLLLGLLLSLGVITAAAQPAANNNGAANGAEKHGPSQKIYFPARLLQDSAALSKAIPGLAQQMIAVYHDSDKMVYRDHAFRHQLLAGNYKNAIALLDSIQAAYNSMGMGIQFKSYAIAKEQEKAKEGAFNQVYTNTYSRLFQPLSFNEKFIAANAFNPSNVQFMANTLQQIMERLKKQNEDSITIVDAQTLLRYYTSKMVLDQVSHLSVPFFTADLNPIRPIIKNNEVASIVPVPDADEIPDPTLHYNLVMEITSNTKTQREGQAIRNLNGGLVYMARLLNLHAATGIPARNIHAVAVVHAAALPILLRNEAYQKRHGKDNPDLALLKELQDAGVKFIVCGQTMTYAQVRKEDLLPGTKVSLTAQTALSGYRMKNYVYYGPNE